METTLPRRLKAPNIHVISLRACPAQNGGGRGRAEWVSEYSALKSSPPPGGGGRSEWCAGQRQDFALFSRISPSRPRA